MNNKTQLLVIKGALSDMPPDQQQRVMATVEAIRKAIADCGDLGVIALALVGLEKSIEAGEE